MQILKYPFTDVVSLFIKYRKPDTKFILEIGCGTGNNIVFFAENGCIPSGIDINNKALKFAREFLQSKDNCFFYNCDAESLRYSDGELDAVLDRACLQHNRMDKIKRILSEVYRVLKPGGLFFLINFRSKADSRAGNFKDNPTFENYDHVEFVTEEELRTLLSDFKILYFEHRKSDIVENGRKYRYATFLAVCEKSV